MKNLNLYTDLTEEWSVDTTHCGEEVTEDKAVMRRLLDNIEKKFLKYQVKILSAFLKSDNFR